MTEQPKDSSFRNGPQILILDDDHFSINPMIENLTDQGMNVTSASTVDKALEALNDDMPYDVILADIMMPANKDFDKIYGDSEGGLLTGLRLAEHAKKLKPNVPLIAYTTNANRSFHERLSTGNSPFDEVISKSTFSDNSSFWSNIHERYISRKLNRSKEWVHQSINQQELVLYESNPKLFKKTFEEFQERRNQITVSLNENLLKVLNGNIDRLPELSPREFEEVCALSLSRLGYDVTITPQGPDDGIDLIAVPEKSLVRAAYLVQCKRNRIDRRVGTPILKNLKCTVADYRASGGVVMTSSFFTSGAAKYAKKNQYLLQLFDVLRLKSILEEGS